MEFIVVLDTSRNKKTFLKFHDEPIWIELQPLLSEAFEHIYLHYGTKNIEDIFEDEKLSFAKGAVTETVKKRKEIVEKTLTEKIDSILIHKFFWTTNFYILNVGTFSINF